MNTLMQAVLDATLVSKCVLAFLVCMSIGSWAYMSGKWFQLRSARRQCMKIIALAEPVESIHDILESVCENSRTPFYGIALKGVREFNRIKATGDADRLIDDNVRRALHQGIETEISRLRSSLALLATAANTAPFIGLFGTVWGIMHSFQAIASMKSISLATVAPGIAEALIATAVGLFVAIPATCGYNVFKARLSEIQGDCINFAGMLLNRLQHEVSLHPEGISFSRIQG